VLKFSVSLYFPHWVTYTVEVDMAYRDRNRVIRDVNDFRVERDYTDYPYIEDLGDPSRPRPRPAGDKYPTPGVSGVSNKMSGSQDWMIGSRRGNGEVNDNANETVDFSRQDKADSGLIMRQPL
jgi:hypothetical protein